MSKLGLVFILISVLIFVGLSIELLYVLCYRRRFQRSSSGDSELAIIDGGKSFRSPSSKDLIHYLLCCKKQSQVKPTTCDGAADVATTSLAASPRFMHEMTEAQPRRPAAWPETAEEEEEYDLEKLQAMRNGAPRFLYTIKEDERGETASSGSSEKEVAEVTTPPFTTPFYTPNSSPS